MTDGLHQQIEQLKAIIVALENIVRSPETPKTDEPATSQGQENDVLLALIRERLDPDLVSVEVTCIGPVVRTTRFIEKETWHTLNATMRGMGLKWVSDGKNSHWEKEV
jgi:hypothetical protein